MLSAVVASTFLIPPKKPNTANPHKGEGGDTGQIYRNGTFIGYSDATDHGYGVAIVSIENEIIVDVILKEFSEMSIEKDFADYEYKPSVLANSLLPQRFKESDTTSVQGISGATASFGRYRQAVERALQRASAKTGDGLFDGVFQGRSKADNHGYGIARITIHNGEMTQVDLREVCEEGDEFKDFTTYPHEPSRQAYAELPHWFVEKNSQDIDNFTGATHSTDKYKEAVANALAKAQLKTPTPRPWDGTYTAISDTDTLGYAQASITIENGEIVDVRLLEFDEDSVEKDYANLTYEPWVNANKELPWSFIAAQSAEVDAVTGATHSCMHYRQAVERALQKAELSTHRNSAPISSSVSSRHCPGASASSSDNDPMDKRFK